jgi:HAD superfamily hydrolase (TIGR01484 family)
MTRCDFSPRRLVNRIRVMQALHDFKGGTTKVLFTDIDGTITENGRLPMSSYAALCRLRDAGIQLIPVTGRPAGWCDLIARLWPVHGVIGENGALAYRYDGTRMQRHEFLSRQSRQATREKLKQIAMEVRKKVPGSRIAADQFCRRFDLAIDFAEDVKPLPAAQIQAIKNIFIHFGAHAKVSNIHVNGWFGKFDKLTTCQWYCQNWLGFTLEDQLDEVAFVGDSPNDEPMFGFFKNSFAVANVKKFLPQMKSHPTYIATQAEAAGFCEITEQIIGS